MNPPRWWWALLSLHAATFWFTGCATPCRPCPEVAVTCKDNSPRLRERQNYHPIPILMPDFGRLPDGGLVIL